MELEVIYLACPYSHPDPQVRYSRFLDCCAATAELVRRGTPVFSPIAQSHPLTDYLPEYLCTDMEFWMRVDLPVLERCSKVVVLTLDGWQASRGVARELEHARKLGIPIEHMTPVPTGVLEPESYFDRE